jgi:hypothetical protein
MDEEIYTIPDCSRCGKKNAGKNRVWHDNLCDECDEEEHELAREIARKSQSP